MENKEKTITSSIIECASDKDGAKIFIHKYVIKTNKILIIWRVYGPVCTLILAILVILISQNGQNIYFVKHYSHSNTFKMVNSTTIKSNFSFFLSHKILF